MNSLLGIFFLLKTPYISIIIWRDLNLAQSGYGLGYYI